MIPSYLNKQRKGGAKRSFLQSSALCGLVVSAGLLGATAALADEVTLKAKDGSSTITANLMSYDGNRFILETNIGEIQIDASLVDCVSGACPTEGAAGDAGEALAITGNGYVVDGLLPALLNDFATGVNGVARTSGNDISISAANGDALGTVSLSSGNPAQSVQQLGSQEAVLAVSDQVMTPTQARAVVNAGKQDPTQDDRQVVLALDGLVIVVAPDNPVNAISPADIAGIFSGRIRNWAQLGGPNAPINLYAPAADSTVMANFAEQVMQPNGANLANGATTLETDKAVSEAVAADPFGIGFANFSGKSAGKAISILGSCGIQAPPTAFSIKTEEYPFTRRLFVYRAEDNIPALANDFLGYLDSQDAQAVISESGFIDKSVSLISSDEQGRRYASAMWPTDAQTSLRELGEMVQELLPAQRVSLTFRFLPSSANLEARGLEDLDRLADLLAEGEVFANKELLLVGFTDSAGTAAANRQLSQQRADRVAEILRSVALPGSLDSTPIRTLGYGEASPLTCNDTATGRSTNRRVEVWVRDILKTN